MQAGSPNRAAPVVNGFTARTVAEFPPRTRRRVFRWSSTSDCPGFRFRDAEKFCSQARTFRRQFPDSTHALCEGRGVLPGTAWTPIEPPFQFGELALTRTPTEHSVWQWLIEQAGTFWTNGMATTVARAAAQRKPTVPIFPQNRAAALSERALQIRVRLLGQTSAGMTQCEPSLAAKSAKRFSVGITALKELPITSPQKKRNLKRLVDG